MLEMQPASVISYGENAKVDSKEAITEVHVEATETPKGLMETVDQVPIPSFRSNGVGIQIQKSEASSARDKLYMKYSRKTTICMSLSWCINTGLVLFSHIGLSAVIFSSICPSSFSGCPAGLDIPTTNGETDLCSSNPSDSALLTAGQPAFDDIGTYMSTFGRSCFFNPNQQPAGFGCVQFKVMTDYSLSEDCALCFQEQAECSQKFCTAQCISESTLDACTECSFENCIPQFRVCTGIPSIGTESSSRILIDYNTDCIDRGSVELFEVFNLTFINSVGKALRGGAPGLGLLIIVTSGVWPYLENVLMAVAWFAPLTAKRRHYIMRFLSIIGKWTMVDVFSVVLLINGVIIQKIFNVEPLEPLLVFVQSRPALYSFGVAAVWALIHEKILAKFAEETYPYSPGVLGMRDKKNHGIFYWRLRLFAAVTALMALCLSLLGYAAVNINFRITGLITTFPGPNEFSYNTFELVSGLVDSCARYSGNDFIPGAFFLTIMFLLFVIIVPLLSFILMIVSSLRTHHTKQDEYILWLTSFAAVDVYMLSLVVLAQQFEALLAAAIGDGIDEECGISAPTGEYEYTPNCLTFKGEVGGGWWFLLSAVFCFWCSQYALTRIILG